ncbi:hypothetical protein [Pseudarthrobacter sp. PS3-L1]|uniref:FMN-binding protein n=1 Tax=Pseudarthrobacter sp. PS3-L1 TaxID=3046207 RepID=UPI0024BBD7A3|nr:hypothetical protein [Pseudarthrobacter sp. PS3-L1]MDJ0321554.1 hypothetical protein [Pseudarthrobacter sp. PS3-L1]
MRASIRKTVFAGIAGLSLAGTVAGCAPSASTDTAETPAPAASSAAAAAPSAASSAAPGGAATTTYKDGTYSADGNYNSPNGQEVVGVELTLAADVVTAVNITQHPSNPNTKKYQGEFADGIAAQVVGKNVDEIKVSKVAGSSLTSGGFNSAVDTIKSEAS